MQGWSCGLQAYTEVQGQSYRSYMYLIVCVGVCEKHILQKKKKNWRSIKLQCPNDTQEPCEETSRSVPLHRINWRFF